MEPLAALSLAANVVDVVYFSASIVSKTSELYNSTHGQLFEHTDIITTSSDLNRLTTKLSDSIALRAMPSVFSEDDQALQTLCDGCIEVSQELQDGLNRLQTDGSRSKWRSLRKALKTIWAKEHISELQCRLAAYRDQLDSRIIVGIKSQLDAVGLQQSEAFDRLDDEIKDLVNILLDSSGNIERKIEQHAAIMSAEVESNVRLAQRSISDAVDNAGKAHRRDIRSVEAKLTDVQVSGAKNLSATQDSREQLIAGLACSTAVSSAEHGHMRAELTQQWKSAEEQISLLREEIENLKTSIAASIERAISNGARPQDKKQKRMNEETNLLYKVLVAKDLMLQKLLVSSIYLFQSPFKFAHMQKTGVGREHKEPPI